jgi:DnaJ-class molecular chaperone
MNADFYAILGVSKSASQAEIKMAYVRLSKALHPDVNPNGAALMQQVNEAYEVLGDVKKRAAYDRGEKVREFPKANASRATGRFNMAEYVSDDGKVNFVAMTASFTPEGMREAVIPLLGEFLSGMGITPEAASVTEVLNAAGVLKKKRGAKKSA